MDAPEALDAALEEEEAAIQALEASPLVKSVGKLRGARAGVYARLWCTCEHPQRDSEQLNITKTRQSIQACATELLALVNERHGAHAAAAEAACTAAAAEAAATAGQSAPPTAFAAMAAAHRVRPAAEKAKTAEKLASEARMAARAAEAQLEAANEAVQAAEAEARRLEEEERSETRTVSSILPSITPSCQSPVRPDTPAARPPPSAILPPVAAAGSVSIPS